MERYAATAKIIALVLVIAALAGGLGLFAFIASPAWGAGGAGGGDGEEAAPVVMDRYSGEFGLEGGFKLLPAAVLVLVLGVFLLAGRVLRRQGRGPGIFGAAHISL